MGGKIPPFFILLFVVNLIVTKPHKKVAQGFKLFHGRVSFQFYIIAPLRSLFCCAPILQPAKPLKPLAEPVCQVAQRPLGRLPGLAVGWRSKRNRAMRPEYATPEDFATWEARAKTMTMACLAYTVRDCQQAAEAMRGWNPVKEGFYIDQACTYGMELTRRRRAV